MMLDDVQALARVDQHDTRRVLAEFPQQCRQARGLLATPPIALARPRLVVMAGMGGSAAGGDLLATCAAETLEVPVLVHRGYGLPTAAGREALVIASSYSGDTAEVVSAVEVALARRVPVVLDDVRIGLDRVVDAEGASVALADDADVWSLLALTGGRPTRLFGELEETRLRPLTVVVDGEVVGL